MLCCLWNDHDSFPSFRLAQEKTIAEAQFERSRAETDEAIAQSRLNLSHSGESADMAKYALVNDSSAEGDTVLSAGDFIGYQCKVRKVTSRAFIHFSHTFTISPCPSDLQGHEEEPSHRH